MMRPRNSVLVFAIVGLLASALMAAPAAGAGHADIECDHEYVKVHGNSIKVLPTGDDDTANLQCALDLAASKKWAKVRLIAGEYQTGFLEVEGFNGVFKGAGRHLTQILTLPEGLDCPARLDLAGELALMTFAASDVTLKGFTVAIGGEAPCAEPWAGFEEDGFGFQERSIIGIAATPYLGWGECAAGSTDHRLRAFGVGIESEFPDFDQPFIDFTNFSGGILVSRPMFDVEACPDTWLNGPVVVRGSHFSGNGVSLLIHNLDDSYVVIGGPKPWHGNRFDDVGIGMLFSETNGTRAYVKRNHIIGAHWWGVLGVGDPFLNGDDPSAMMVAKNHIIGVDTADGVGLLDFGPEFDRGPLMHATIAYNSIEVNSDFNGVFAIGTGGEIVGNRIAGAMWTGIMLEGIYLPPESEEGDATEVRYPSNGWLIAGNHLKGVEPILADIWLTEATAENTVICRCRADLVIDDGVDNEIVHCTLAPPEEPDISLRSMTTTRLVRPDKALPLQGTRRGR